MFEVETGHIISGSRSHCTDHLHEEIEVRTFDNEEEATDYYQSISIKSLFDDRVSNPLFCRPTGVYKEIIYDETIFDYEEYTTDEYRKEWKEAI